MQAKREYCILLESGELLTMFPSMTGKWEKDKREFIKYHELNEMILNDIDINVSEELEEGYNDDF